MGGGQKSSKTGHLKVRTKNGETYVVDIRM
jgi:hypothetical protein